MVSPILLKTEKLFESLNEVTFFLKLWPELKKILTATYTFTDHTITDWHCHNIFPTVGLFALIGPLVCLGKNYVRSICVLAYALQILNLFLMPS